MIPQVVRLVPQCNYADRKPEKRARNMKNLSLNLNDNRRDHFNNLERRHEAEIPTGKYDNAESFDITNKSTNNTNTHLTRNIEDLESISYQHRDSPNLQNNTLNPNGINPNGINPNGSFNKLENSFSSPCPNDYKTTILQSSPSKTEIATPQTAYAFASNSPKTSIRTKRAMFSPVVVRHDESLRYVYDKTMSSLCPSTDNLALLALLPQSSCEVQMVSTKFLVPEELQEQNVNAYPKGPQNVLNDQIFLYLDPNGEIDIREYDLVVNVARECVDLSALYGGNTETREYMYVPWTHTSLILQELPSLVRKIDKYFDRGGKVLVHCQCGVSRLACVIVAFYMYKFGLGVNEAYETLKLGTRNIVGHTIEPCDRICPNMLLIFELMEFGDQITKERRRKGAK